MSATSAANNSNGAYSGGRLEWPCIRVFGAGFTNPTTRLREASIGMGGTAAVILFFELSRALHAGAVSARIQYRLVHDRPRIRVFM